MRLAGQLAKAMARRVLPFRARLAFWHATNQAAEWKKDLHLLRMRRRFSHAKHGSSVQFLHYTLRVNDGDTFYILWKDIFINRVYHFEAQRSNPLILDCGSNFGVSILYFKKIYPQARIIGFEPDPSIFPHLKENIVRNRLTDVRLVQAALAGQEGTLGFYSDGNCGSYLSEHSPIDNSRNWTRYEVPCVPLREYLTEPVDFLKLNIEGAEWEVLAHSEDRLHFVREMNIQYHHLPGLPRTLSKILCLLDRQNFEYVVSDFGLDLYGRARPPVSLDREARHYRQIYARRRE